MPVTGKYPPVKHTCQSFVDECCGTTVNYNLSLQVGRHTLMTSGTDLYYSDYS